MCKPYVLQHAALSEYRPILATSPLSNSLSSMADRKLTLIPIIFIVLRIWSTIRFILMLVDSPVRQNPVLVTLHVSSVTVELLLIMLIYNNFDASSFSIINPVFTTCVCVFSGHWKHFPGGSQLHHVCVVYSTHPLTLVHAAV